MNLNTANEPGKCTFNQGPHAAHCDLYAAGGRALPPRDDLKNEPPLYPFQVTLEEDPGDKGKLHFNCWAEDADHAAEQAESAYPGCKVTHEAKINDTPYVQGAAFPEEFS